MTRQDLLRRVKRIREVHDYEEASVMLHSGWIVMEIAPYQDKDGNKKAAFCMGKVN